MIRCWDRRSYAAPPALARHRPASIIALQHALDGSRSSYRPLEHEEGEVILRQPLGRRWRQQVELHGRPRPVVLGKWTHPIRSALPCRAMRADFSPTRGAQARGPPRRVRPRRGAPQRPAASEASGQAAGLTLLASATFVAAAAREGTAEQGTPGGAPRSNGSEEVPRAKRRASPRQHQRPRSMPYTLLTRG